MKVGSLFSGIAGMDRGLHLAGMEIAFQVEIDPFCRRVLERHYPNVPRYGDVREVSGHDLKARHGTADLLCGGFPCQDLSVAGRRAGLAGKRSGLFHEFMRIAAELAPRWLLIENVPGLLSSNGGRDMGIVLGTLGELGYGWAYRVLDSQFFGVPQRRRRVFIVGCLGDARSAAAVLFEPDSCEGHPAPSRETGKVAPTIPASGAGTSRTGAEEGRGHGVPSIAHTLRSEGFDGGEDGTGRGTPMVVDGPFPTLRGFGHGWQGQHWDDVARALTSKNTRINGDTETFVTAPPLISSQEGDKWGSNQWVDAWGEPMNAPGLVRRLTPLECEKLQGLPPDWTAVDGDKTPDSPRYRAVGNAVTVQVAQWIGKRMMEADPRRRW